MKLICINTFNKPLTKGKAYEVLDEGHIGGIPVYYMKMDHDYATWIIRSAFLTIEDMREQKINQILNES